ncbi:hypothetical protein [Gemmatimonas sp.]|jgi:hypothetical protein|uniref:hypothetical protein n=1 Tax=Gemmatimonas sp. TaxID=1962908 RepID=UPI0037C08B9A
MSRSPLAIAAVTATALLGGCASAPPPATTASRPVAIAPVDSAPPAPTDGLSASFHTAFDSADTRARSIAYWLQCVPTIARLRADGSFGAAARAPRGIYCQRTADGVPIGVVYDVDSAFNAVRRVQALRLDTRAAYAEPLDTALLLRAIKLARDVSAQVSPQWAQRRRPFSVVPITTANAATEAWVIPRATKARSVVTGGDVGYAAPASGRTPTLLEDRTTTWTQLNLAPTGTVRLYSSTREVPAVSDLVTARYYAELGRPVTVSTPAVISELSSGFDAATGSRIVWKHTPAQR